MPVYFMHLHVLDAVVILEEGNIPHPRCPQCDMLVPWRTLNRRHPATAQCTRGADCKRRKLVEEELRESTERAFEAYGDPLENMTEFKYLGRFMTAVDDDWPALVGNLRKARKSWGRLSRILSREGADPNVSGHIFKAVTQVVLLFGAETRVLTPRMERALSSFQHRVAQPLTGRQPRRQGGGSWEYPSLEGSMVEAGFEGVGTYITRRQNTVADYISTRPILDLCEQSAWRTGVKVSQRWW